MTKTLKGLRRDAIGNRIDRSEELRHFSNILGLHQWRTRYAFGSLARVVSRERERFILSGMLFCTVGGRSTGGCGWV